MTRGELLEKVSSRELSEWIAYYGLEPWGEAQSEYRAALVTSMIANTARDDKKHPQPFRAEEFMREGYLMKDDEPVNLLDKAKGIFGMMGAKK
jgi:hypothetical protein